MLIVLKNAYNKRLKRDCQRVAFPVPRAVVVAVVCLSSVLCVASPLGGRYEAIGKQR